MSRIKAGIIGMGFIGVSHIDAVRRIGFAELLAVADVNDELAKKKADEYYIPKCYKTVDEMLADPEIQIVHNCTPNNLHFEINRAALAAGKHVLSEKPLGRNSEEARRMVEAGVKGVEFIAVNTDAQALLMSDADYKVHIGVNLTKGLGAGADPDVGLQAAEEKAVEDEWRGAGTVLLVDDDSLMRRIIAQTLQSSYEVIQAENACPSGVMKVNDSSST